MMIPVTMIVVVAEVEVIPIQDSPPERSPEGDLRERETPLPSQSRPAAPQMMITMVTMVMATMTPRMIPKIPVSGGKATLSD